MPKRDPNIAAHLEWIGFVRPTGLVVSAPALDRAGAILDRRDVEGAAASSRMRRERCFAAREEPQPWLPDFRAFASSVLGWSFSPIGYAGTDETPIPAELEAVPSDSGAILRPDFAVRTEPLRSAADAPPWQPSRPGLRAGRGPRPRRTRRGRPGSVASRAHGAPVAPHRRTGGPALQRPPRYACSRRRAAKARAGSIFAWRTWSRPPAGRSANGSNRHWCPTAPSTGCWRSSSSSTASASPTAPWTSSISVPSTRP